jgi:anaerobic magnesium-protoporphyrin IX monomethyl ester cyclase
MRVLLCQSYLGPASSIAPLVFPIGLAYIASAIKDNNEVYCWDPNTSEDPMNEFSRLLEKTDPNIVGVSLRNVDSALSSKKYWYYPRFVSMIKTLREKVPSCKIVVGGPGFSLFAEEIMRRIPEIDFGIVLEGEQAFAQLLKNLEHPERVSNLVFRENDQIHFTERQTVDFGSLPLPSRELFDLSGYRKKSYSMNVQTKRGCEFNCIFCPNNFLSGYAYRFRSPKNVVDEIEQIKNVYGIDSLRFVDSTFNYPFEYALKICRELARRKLEIHWTADFHATFINETFMREAVQSGCSVFNFSPDGASDKTLAMLGKDMRVEHIKNTISLTKKIDGANASYSFMYDLPYYNSEHMVGLARLIPRMVFELGHKLFGIYLTRIRIYPYAPLYDLAVNEQLIPKCADILYPIYYSSSSSLSIENITANLIAKFGLLFEITKKLKII